MIIDGQIKVGNTTFRVDVLQDMTLTQAYERFDYLRKDVVKRAYEIANPKRRSKKKSKK